MVLQCLIRSRGDAIISRGFATGSSSVGIASNSSMMGRGSMASIAEVTTTFSLK